MLQNLSKQVRECMMRAEECAYRAKTEPDANLAKEYIEMELRWLSLARSHAFAEQLDAFTKHNKQRGDEASETLAQLTGKLTEQISLRSAMHHDPPAGRACSRNIAERQAVSMDAENVSAQYRGFRPGL